MLYHLRKLRGLVSIDAEYAIRRAGFSLLPRKQAPFDALFHCCVHKTASQWVRLILSDPRFFRETGLYPYFAPRMNLRDPKLRGPVPDRSVVSSFFTNKQTLLEIEKPANWRAFFVTRDPRDLLVSRYFSARYSHRQTGNLGALRSNMVGMTEEEGILYILEHQYDVLAQNLLSFLAASPHDDAIRIVRFEELTGSEQLQTWLDLLKWTGLDIPERTVQTLLEFYSMKNMRAPNASGKKTEKYRSGKLGDWRNHFTPAVDDAFRRRYGSLASDLGYQ